MANLFRPRSTSLSGEGGVSLLECICAIVIVGSSLAASASMLGTQEQTFQILHDDGYSQIVLRRELERVYATSFLFLTSTAGFEPVPDEPGYEREIDVAGVAVDLRRVTLTLRWTTPSGSIRSETVDTYCFDRRS